MGLDGLVETLDNDELKVSKKKDFPESWSSSSEKLVFPYYSFLKKLKIMTEILLILTKNIISVN